MSEEFDAFSDDEEQGSTAVVDEAEPQLDLGALFQAAGWTAAGEQTENRNDEGDSDDVLEDGEQPTSEIITEALFSTFLKDVQALATKTIHAYFDDKQMFCGGPIPATVLDSPEYITQLLNTDMSCMARAYDAIRASGMFESSDGEAAVGEDIRYVIKLVHHLEKCRIPRCFLPGILLMHMEFIEGISMD